MVFVGAGLALPDFGRGKPRPYIRATCPSITSPEKLFPLISAWLETRPFQRGYDEKQGPETDDHGGSCGQVNIE